MNPRTTVGTLVNVGGTGVLIAGKSGSGKSFAALKLLAKGHRFVSDDIVKVAEDDTGVLMGYPAAVPVRVEIRGLGIFNVDSLFPGSVVNSSRIDFAVELVPYDPIKDAGRVSPKVFRMGILNQELQCVILPLFLGADAALLIEMLVSQYKENGMQFVHE
jgi:HPr kinase/phosphorylase